MAARSPARKSVTGGKAATRASTPARAPMPSRSKRAQPESLTEQAYAQLEELIVTLQLEPGTTVSELALSEMTGIGRTPIREAIQRLAREHLILILPQRGLLIPEIDVKKQLRLLRTRREVERLICRSAAKSATPQERDVFAQLAAEFQEASRNNDDVSFVRLDREFNELCLIAARNEFAEGAMRQMHGLSRRFWYVHYRQAADLPEMARLHGAVAQAIAEGGVDDAGQALDALLDNIEEFTRSTVFEV
ncbi:GntR family transcriptional regulator [Paraburkholderia sp. RL17-337-BIB-A]